MCLKDKRSAGVVIAGFLASLLASALLLDFRHVFYVDWNNHLWVIEYFGECIKHFNIPHVINTLQIVGMPTPLFYGQKFYAFAGLASAVAGSAITIRAMVFTVFLLQFFQVYRASMKAGSSRNIAVGIAVMVTWAIYPLTNLYNRCALTEFFAVAFLTCAVMSFLCVVIDLKGRVSRYDMAATGFFFVAAAVTHPLTALFGGLFLGILGAMTLFFGERNKKLWLLAYFSITAFLSLLVLSPWIYLLSQFKNKLTVFSHATNALFFQKEYFFPASVDNIFSRLSPFPLDLRSIQKGVQDQNSSAPYLDAQITLPLVILIAVLIYTINRDKNVGFRLSTSEGAIIRGAALMLFIFLIESVCPKAFDWLGGVFNTLQFPYRLTTYVNLSALAILIFLAGGVGRVSINNKQLINLGLAFCLAISFSALMQKLVHASAIAQKSTQANKGSWSPVPFGSDSHLNELPSTFYAAGDYVIKDGFEKGTVSGTVPYTVRNFNVSDGIRFGQVEPLFLSLTQPTLVVTNVEAFPWNRILINGSFQYPYSVIAVGGRGAVFLPQGSYRLDFVNRVDGIWTYLNFLSWFVFLGWMVLYAVFAFRLFKEERP